VKLLSLTVENVRVIKQATWRSELSSPIGKTIVFPRVAVAADGRV